MSGRLAGKTVVITGAGQGIGHASVIGFVAEGATVWAVDRNAESLASLAAALPPVHTVVLDVTDAAGIAALPEVTGPIDVLFNCAGFVHAGSILECSEDDWHTAMDVNVTSMYRLIRAYLPGMIDAGGGTILNMASVVSSISGVPNRFAYGASKAAVIGLTKAIAADHVADGIRCNAIAPGTVDTPSLGERLAVYEDPDDARAQFVARQKMGRLGTAEEIAALAVYLASDEAAYTTGSVHVIDGGMTL